MFLDFYVIAATATAILLVLVLVLTIPAAGLKWAEASLGAKLGFLLVLALPPLGWAIIVLVLVVQAEGDS